MEHTLHILALGWFAFFAAIWKAEGWFNILLKVALAASAAFAAVVVAGDLM